MIVRLPGQAERLLRGEELEDVLVRALGATSPLVIPLGRSVVAAWIGTREPFDERLLDGRGFTAQGEAPALAAFGTPGAGVDGFAHSHREAMHARRVGQLFGHRPGTITRYRNVALTALASADLDHTRDFVAAELGPLAADDDNTRRLAATLRVYLEEHASPRRAAQRLGVHENTIANRIRTVQELLARPIDTRVPELLVALRLAPALYTTRTDQRNPPRGR